MTTLRAGLGVACMLSLLCACAGSDPDRDAFRGPGLHAAKLSTDSRARAYDAAIRAAFDPDDQAVSILLDDRLLPRSAGVDSAGTIPAASARELEQRGTIRGVCHPKLGIKGTAKCASPLPGYVVRFTDVLMSGGDTARVYLWAEKYDNAKSGFSAPMRFERAYQLVRSGTGWRAAQEAHIPVT